jgi:magnesium transporter
MLCFREFPYSIWQSVPYEILHGILRTMVFRHDYKGGVWVDLEQPTEEEIRGIAQEFGFSPQIEKEMLLPTPSPIVISEETATLLVLHFPTHSGDPESTETQEVDFVVGPHFIITVRYEVVAPLYHLKKLFEAQKAVVGKGSVTTDILLEVLFAHLYTSVRDHTNYIADNLDRVEREMFDGHERTTIRAISNVNRKFLRIESCLAHQEEPLLRFLHALENKSMFGTAFAERIHRITAERARIARLVATHRAITTELRETNLALVESRQSEIMKILTIMTVLILPLELIAVTLDIHVPDNPLLDDPNGFLILIAIMVATVGLMMLFFARKRWIF